MVKKLDNIQDLKERSKEFHSFLQFCLNSETLSFLENLSTKTTVIIFSGLIRNFFINSKEDIRDLDLVVGEIDHSIEKIINDYDNRRNSFGGYKININSLNIDLWELNNTWAFIKNKVDPLLFKELNLPDTTFFNFSSIIYNYNIKEFILGDSYSFKKFIETKELDYVLEDNPYPQLCIVNTIYYKEKFNLNVSKKLKKYFVEYFPKYSSEDFDQIQLKHFNKIEFSYAILKTYFKIFQQNIK